VALGSKLALLCIQQKEFDLVEAKEQHLCKLIEKFNIGELSGLLISSSLLWSKLSLRSGYSLVLKNFDFFNSYIVALFDGSFSSIY